MDKMIEELKKVVKFKKRTEVGDHVLILSKEPQVAVYAVVRSIERDTARKDEWWHVGMTLLTLPPQDVTWTLREEQFSGQVVFTMQGVEHFIQAVQIDSQAPLQHSTGSRQPAKKKQDDKPNPFHIIK